MGLLPMGSSSDCVVLPMYFKLPYHLDQLNVAELYSSYMSEPILSISAYAVGMLRSITSPSVTLCCWSRGCSVSVGFISLFVSMPILENMVIVKVNQLYSYQNDCFGCRDESEWHSAAHSMLW